MCQQSQFAEAARYDSYKSWRYTERLGRLIIKRDVSDTERADALTLANRPQSRLGRPPEIALDQSIVEQDIEFRRCRQLDRFDGRIFRQQERLARSEPCRPAKAQNSAHETEQRVERVLSQRKTAIDN